MAACRFSGSICFRLGAAALAILTSAIAANADDFYKGQTITLILGSPSGGGYDSYARPLARYLGKHIPGSPTVILQNGEPLLGTLRRERISIDDLHAAARMQGYTTLADIRLAVLEANGQISFFNRNTEDSEKEGASDRPPVG